MGLHKSDYLQLGAEREGWLVETRLVRFGWCNPDVNGAYIAASSARFEHGVKGRPT